MKGYFVDLENVTEDNSTFRTVLYTGKHMQLVAMSLLPREEIGFEVHTDTDQFLRCGAGEGKVIVDDTEYAIKDDSAVIVPAGARHNVINTSDTESLKLYTLYGPSHHKDKTVHTTKQDALASDEAFDGVTSE
jgi:mannose-6-phosphate isomerase-like protein (cupin superfamily)